jgi:hypothetical protein
MWLLVQMMMKNGCGHRADSLVGMLVEEKMQNINIQGYSRHFYKQTWD